MESRREILKRHPYNGQETLETDTRQIVRSLTTYDGIILDLGSAGFKRKKEIELKGGTCFAVDINPKKADVVSDLNSDFPFVSKSVTMIIASEIIEHLNNYEKFLHECYRVLKPQGRLILTTPNLASYHARISIMLGKKPIFYPPFGGHTQLFTLNEIQSLLIQSGFKVSKIIGIQGYTSDKRTWKYPFHVILSKTIDRWFPSLAIGCVILCEK